MEMIPLTPTELDDFFAGRRPGQLGLLEISDETVSSGVALYMMGREAFQLALSPVALVTGKPLPYITAIEEA